MNATIEAIKKLRDSLQDCKEPVPAILVCDILDRILATYEKMGIEKEPLIEPIPILTDEEREAWRNFKE